MKNYLKTLFGVTVATFLLVGCSGPEKKSDVQIQPEPVKETKTMILIKTTKGDIKLELDATKAPKTVA
ncbi:MAG: peptidyl-prolyl cis-trans isomerase, partial [Verrucomicrobia bacterium]|nr:peptidyl-prolyl cis-trans isomerase [Verrucomicrobiota bacterium]